MPFLSENIPLSSVSMHIVSLRYASGASNEISLMIHILLYWQGTGIRNSVSMEYRPSVLAAGSSYVRVSFRNHVPLLVCLYWCCIVLSMQLLHSITIVASIAIAVVFDAFVLLVIAFVLLFLLFLLTCQLGIKATEVFLCGKVNGLWFFLVLLSG